MKTLEEIADNPEAATISENLVLVADPFEYAKRKSILSQKKIDEVVQALQNKFVEGEGLVHRFRNDLMQLESQRTFVPYVPLHVFEKLGLLMVSRPALLVNQLQRLWRNRERIKKGMVLLPDEEKSAFEVAQYTHQWHQYVEKQGRYNPFQHLQKIPEYGIKVNLRKNPNACYPGYALYGWQEEIKIMDRIVKKLLLKIFETIEDARKEKKDFWDYYFGTDYFGHKVIGTSAYIDHMIAGLVFGSRSNWIPREDDPEDYRVSKREEGKNLRAKEYLLKYKHSNSTEAVQVQVTTFFEFLLDEFFYKDGHPLFRVRRDADLRQYRRQNSRLYDRMGKSMAEVLSFLPR